MNDHPEGLTEQQEALADLLITTKTHSKVRRRLGTPGNWHFEVMYRDTHPIDFAQEGEFVFKHHEANPDAPLSPVYCNLRNLPDNVLQKMAEVMAAIPENENDEKPQYCVGIPEAGIPIGNAYSKVSGIPHIEILKKIENEKGRMIIADPEKIPQYSPSNIRIVDDLVTKGLTKIETIKALQNTGITITDLTVLIDYERGARAELAKLGVPLRAAFTTKQLFDYYLRVGSIDQDRHEAIIAYVTSNS